MQVSNYYFLLIMRKSYKQLIFFLIFILSENPLFSQIDSPSFSVATGNFFNIEMGSDSYHNATMFGVYVAPSLKIKRSEFSTGVCMPLVFKEYINDEKVRHRIGSTTNYWFYILNPNKIVNLILQYEFQYIYYTIEEDVYDPHGSTHLEEKYKNYNNLIGFGFIGFFDTNHNFGFSTVFSYMFPVQHYFDYRNGVCTYDEVFRWGHSEHMDNYININLALNIKLISLKKEK